jgi:hypothetical protein
MTTALEVQPAGQSIGTRQPAGQTMPQTPPSTGGRGPTIMSLSTDPAYARFVRAVAQVALRVAQENNARNGKATVPPAATAPAGRSHGDAAADATP